MLLLQLKVAFWTNDEYNGNKPPARMHLLEEAEWKTKVLLDKTYRIVSCIGAQAKKFLGGGHLSSR